MKNIENIMLDNIKKDQLSYLRWKCLDDFSSIDKSKMFYNGSYIPSSSMIKTLDPIFLEIKNRYARQIKALFEQEKQCANLVGGIYSFFFCLPKMLKFISKKYPFLSVRLILHNVNGLIEIAKLNYDFVSTVSYPKINDYAFEEVAKFGYIKSRKSFNDKVFLAMGKTAASEYDSVEHAFYSHNILFGRLDEAGDKKYLYSVAPRDREDESPKVVVDSYFMVYLMMLQNAGISMCMSSMSKHEKMNLVVLLDHAVSNPIRFILFKNDAKYLNYFAKIFFKIFRNEGTCQT